MTNDAAPHGQAAHGAPDDAMFVVDSPYEIANWRPLAHWVMHLPHAIITHVLRNVANVVFLIYRVILVFTGKLNSGLYGFMTMHERYNLRATGFLIGFTERYPPFDFQIGPADNLQYPPMTVTLPESPETAPRSAAFNVFLAIPHFVVLALFFIASFVAAVIAWFAVLFTGTWPQGLRDFIVRVDNYYLRVWAYVVMVRPGYPRFGA